MRPCVQSLAPPKKGEKLFACDWCNKSVRLCCSFFILPLINWLEQILCNLWGQGVEFIEEKEQTELWDLGFYLTPVEFLEKKTLDSVYAYRAIFTRIWMLGRALSVPENSGRCLDCWPGPCPFWPPSLYSHHLPLYLYTCTSTSTPAEEFLYFEAWNQSGGVTFPQVIGLPIYSDS